MIPSCDRRAALPVLILVAFANFAILLQIPLNSATLRLSAAYSTTPGDSESVVTAGLVSTLDATG